MPVSAHFLEALRDALPFVAGLRTRRMFGGAGVYAGELMFGLVADDVLYLKADETSRRAFEAEGLEPFRWRDKSGAEMEMSYRRAPESVFEDEDAAREWIERAIAAARRSRKA